MIQELFLTTDITIIVSSHDPKLMEIASKIYKIEDRKITLEESYPERNKKDGINYRPINTLEFAEEEFDEYLEGKDLCIDDFDDIDVLEEE
ncbi:MAG: hypothetical protein ACTSQE_10495 [Candidatus Heimdallarchaeaceae archaeon]